MQPNYMYPYQGYQQPITRPNNAISVIYVSSEDEAKKYIIGPNQTVLLKINEGNLMYEKMSDAQGNCFYKVYEKKDFNTNEESTVTKAELSAVIAKLNALEAKLGGLNEQ